MNSQCRLAGKYSISHVALKVTGFAARHEACPGCTGRYRFSHSDLEDLGEIMNNPTNARPSQSETLHMRVRSLVQGLARRCAVGAPAASPPCPRRKYDRRQK